LNIFEVLSIQVPMHKHYQHPKAIISIRGTNIKLVNSNA